MVNLAVGFADRGTRVDLVAVDARGELRNQVPQHVRVVDLASSRALTSMLALVRYLRRQRPTALIAAMAHSSVVALWARALAGTQTRIIATEHVNLSCMFKATSRLRVRALPFFVRRFLRWADGIVAVSTGVAEDLASVAHLPLDRITVIYNPVLTNDLFEKAQEPVQHPWLASQCTPVVLGVGRLAPQKNFCDLIRAFAQIRQRRPAKLLIIGEGDQRPQLETLTRELGVADDVCLLGYCENPYAYMSRVQVFVLSSTYEGFGLVLVEALATGAPVVSTDCPSGPREILGDGRYGSLVPVGNVNALAEAILSKLDQQKQAVPWEWLHKFEVSAALDAYEQLIATTGESMRRSVARRSGAALPAGDTAHLR
jgi:glycosyltransferase involved in cell wall biosynthesis